MGIQPFQTKTRRKPFGYRRRGPDGGGLRAQRRLFGEDLARMDFIGLRKPGHRLLRNGAGLVVILSELPKAGRYRFYAHSLRPPRSAVAPQRRSPSQIESVSAPYVKERAGGCCPYAAVSLALTARIPTLSCLTCKVSDVRPLVKVHCTFECLLHFYETGHPSRLTREAKTAPRQRPVSIPSGRASPRRGRGNAPG